MKTRPLQIGILVMGAIAAGFSLFWLSRGNDAVKLDHRVTLVDVQNGQLYVVSTARRAIMEPAPVPGTGELRLVRVGKEDDGKWYIAKRAMSTVREMELDSKVVDEETGEVLTPSSDIKKYEPK